MWTRVSTMFGIVALMFVIAGCGYSSGPTSPTPSPTPAPSPTPTPTPAPTPTPPPAPAPTTASLTGTVSNSSGQPLAGARVAVLDGPNTGQSVVANASGQYRFDSLTIGNANFTTTASGYLEDRRGIFVNGTNTLNFVLAPIPPPPPPAPAITITSRIISGGPGTAIQEWGFVATGTVPFITYNWDFGDGVSSTGSGPQEQHVYRTKGTLTVTVTGIRASGSPVVGTLVIAVE